MKTQTEKTGDISPLRGSMCLSQVQSACAYHSVYATVDGGGRDAAVGGSCETGAMTT